MRDDRLTSQMHRDEHPRHDTRFTTIARRSSRRRRSLARSASVRPLRPVSRVRAPTRAPGGSPKVCRSSGRGSHVAALGGARWLRPPESVLKKRRTRGLLPAERGPPGSPSGLRRPFGDVARAPRAHPLPEGGEDGASATVVGVWLVELPGLLASECASVKRSVVFAICVLDRRVRERSLLAGRLVPRYAQRRWRLL